MKITQKQPVIITSIFQPNKVIDQFVRKGFKLIVAGDKKTPSDWVHINCEFLSFDDQVKAFRKFGKLIPPNHYVRKNFAYLRAIQLGAEHIFETDDDNFPTSLYPNFLLQNELDIPVVHSDSHFFNIYQEFSTTKDTLWPRGYPLRKILHKPSVKKEKKRIKSFIQQSLINKDTDVDAIYRLSKNKLVTFKEKKKLALAKHTYCPINSQNTAWFKPVFPLLYLPSTVGSRVCDILRGWVAQRLNWELDSMVTFLSPCVYQLRNEHDYLKDFKDEVPLYLETEHTIEVLEKLHLTGSLESKLIQTYVALAQENVVMPDEIPRVKEWIQTLETLL